jgi:Protein-tyrosine-phosphatase-like, N-terminal domain
MSTATEFSIRSLDAELEREADAVAERFPEVPRATIDAAVHETYRGLAATATVRAHLFTITGSVVMNRLRAQGFAYRPPRRRSPTEEGRR